MGIDHYENFPVASILVPAPLRWPIREIYRFARTADDIADEGQASAGQRLEQLAALRTELGHIASGNYPGEGSWAGLAAAVQHFGLDLRLLDDLLCAFERDVRGMAVHRYEDLYEYCRQSANPVGRLLLTLYRRTEPALLQWSDHICTGLQLVNFWQDIDRDLEKGRLYIPDSEFARFGVQPAQVAQRRTSEAWRRMIAAQTQIAREHLRAGQPLARALGGRIGWELRLVVQGGLRIAERIDAVGGDVFHRRPVLRPADWLRMLARAMVMR